jgi:hypothetical protein
LAALQGFFDHHHLRAASIEALRILTVRNIDSGGKSFSGMYEFNRQKKPRHR